MSHANFPVKIGSRAIYLGETVAIDKIANMPNGDWMFSFNFKGERRIVNSHLVVSLNDEVKKEG